jgi:hypothetical protein
MDSTATTNTSRGLVKRESGFKNHHHDQSTKNRISQTQKMRYNYMRQMMKQHQQEQKQQQFGPIDSPQLTKMIKDIVSQIISEEIKKATPIRQQNIPLF